LQHNLAVSLKALSQRHKQLLCYPSYTEEELQSRLQELKQLHLKALEFTGEKRVLDVPVLGKGCVGITVIAHIASGRAALKIRRVDADRQGMLHESEMLKHANRINVGPKLIGATKNFLLMQLIEGTHFPAWLEALSGEDGELRLLQVLEDVLWQCYRLDEAGLDHGELSNAPKHIKVTPDDKPFLLDFETASLNRRVSNVTSLCQYFFLRSMIADKVKEKLKKFDEEKLINSLRAYKHKRTERNFKKILENFSPPKRLP